MNRFLDRDFSKEEIEQAAFDLNPSKAPGPNGCTATFFQYMWDSIEGDIINDSLEVLSKGGSLDKWNETTITLIPKVKILEKVKDFRLISLCNVSYKIVARVITNRMRKVMDRVIDPNQSAFIPGRLITDNILIGFECMHWLRISKNKEGYNALKLDMTNAYDRVE